MKKIALFIVIILIVFVFTVDIIAKGLLEEYFTNQLHTDVTIGELRTSPLERSVNIDFIEIKNPESYNKSNVISINRVSLMISDRSTTEFVLLNNLLIQGVYLNLEQNTQGVNMLGILRNLEKSATSNSGPTKISTSYNGDIDDSTQIRVAIKEITFADLELNINTQWASEKILLPNIVIRDFGGRHGVPSSMLGAELLRIVLSSVQKEMEGIGMELTENQIKKGIRRKLQSEINEIKENLNTNALNLLEKLGF
jgi:hypothetical protein